MAGVFVSYEQQFSTITADITARISKIPNLVGSKFVYFVLHGCPIVSRLTPLPLLCSLIAEKRTAIGVVQGNIDEAGELVSACEGWVNLLYYHHIFLSLIKWTWKFTTYQQS